MAIPDFTLKNQVPVSSIIDALAQKQARENELHNQNVAQGQNIVNSIKETSATVASWVDASKQKQIRDARNELASILSGGGELVPSGKGTVPASSTMLPKLTEAPQMQPYSETPEYSARLNSTLSRAYPEQYGKQLAVQATKAAFAGVNGKQDSPWQQSALQYVDKSGVPHTVATTFNKDTGKQYNPMTMQEITSSDQLAGLVDRGYAQSTNGAGYDAEGRQVIRDQRTGATRVVSTDENGKQTSVPYNGPIYPALDNPPATFTNAIAELGNAGQLLKDIAQSFDPEFVGPVAARAGKMTQYISALTNDQRVKFYGNIAEYKNSIIKAITGSQMSEIEAKRIIQQIPNENASPEAFLSGVQRAYGMTERRLDQQKKAIQRTGGVVRGKDEVAISAEELSKLIDQKLGRLKTQTVSSKINMQSKKVQSLFDELATSLKGKK